MIIDRLENNGIIREEYKLDFLKSKKEQSLRKDLNLFSEQHGAKE